MKPRTRASSPDSAARQVWKSIMPAELQTNGKRKTSVSGWPTTNLWQPHRSFNTRPIPLKHCVKLHFEVSPSSNGVWIKASISWHALKWIEVTQAGNTLLLLHLGITAALGLITSQLQNEREKKEAKGTTALSKVLTDKCKPSSILESQGTEVCPNSTI